MDLDDAHTTRPTVLVIDDDADTVYVYSHVLGSHGFHVVVCGDGAEAVPAALEARPDVILMDFLLPNSNGWEATRALKAHPGTTAIPVIAISAYGDPAARSAAIHAGCAEFFEKPVSPMVVLQAVRTLTRPATPAIAEPATPFPAAPAL